MKALFTYSSGSLFSWIIRTFTFSKFSHVGIMLSDALVIEATFKNGVVLTTVEEFKSKHKTIYEVTVELPNEQAAINFAIDQLGKPYDLTAIFGLVFKRNWQEPDSWFCSELAEAIFKAGGKLRVREDVSRITPQMSWAIL